jgi:hypothetical protein
MMLETGNSKLGHKSACEKRPFRPFGPFPLTADT